MTEVNNPAGRLLRIIEAGRGEKSLAGMAAHQAFAKILGVDPNNRSLLLQRLALIPAMVDDIRNAVSALTTIDPSLLTVWLPKFLAPWNDLNFGVQFQTFMGPVDDSMMALLKITDDQLGRFAPEAFVKSSDETQLIAQVRKLTLDISNANIPHELKVYLFRFTSIIEAALGEYRLRGYGSLRDGLERCFGHRILNQDAHVAAEKTEVGLSVWEYVVRYAVIVGLAANSLQIVESVIKILPDHSAQTVHPPAVEQTSPIHPSK